MRLSLCVILLAVLLHRQCSAIAITALCRDFPMKYEDTIISRDLVHVDTRYFCIIKAKAPRPYAANELQNFCQEYFGADSLWMDRADEVDAIGRYLITSVPSDPGYDYIPIQSNGSCTTFANGKPNVNYGIDIVKKMPPQFNRSHDCMALFRVQYPTISPGLSCMNCSLTTTEVVCRKEAMKSEGMNAGYITFAPTHDQETDGPKCPKSPIGNVHQYEAMSNAADRFFCLYYVTSENVHEREALLGKLGKGSVTRNEAQEFCNSYGGDLVAVENPGKKSLLFNVAHRFYSDVKKFLIKLYVRNDGGSIKFQPTNGSETYEYKRAEDKNHTGPGEYCYYFYESIFADTIREEPCGKYNNFICEVPMLSPRYVSMARERSSLLQPRLNNPHKRYVAMYNDENCSVNGNYALSKPPFAIKDQRNGEKYCFYDVNLRDSNVAVSNFAAAEKLCIKAFDGHLLSIGDSNEAFVLAEALLYKYKFPPKYLVRPIGLIGYNPDNAKFTDGSNAVYALRKAYVAEQAEGGSANCFFFAINATNSEDLIWRTPCKFIGSYVTHITCRRKMLNGNVSINYRRKE